MCDTLQDKGWGRITPVKTTQNEIACCFTGHRTIASAELPALKKRLENTMEALINQGVVFYACGGAIGFDMLAGFTVLRLKEKYNYIRLIMVLPCRNQDINWPAADKNAYQKLLAAADQIVYVSEDYYDGCMKKRNVHLVENSGFCIAYLRHMGSGTAQTVRIAKERGLTVFNLA